MDYNCLLDTDILLDILLQRPRYDLVKQKLINFNEAFVSSKTFATTFYLLRKTDFSIAQILEKVNYFEILEVDKTDCLIGSSIAKSLEDVEDCMEIALAKRYNLVLLTADQKLVKNYQEYWNLELIQDV